MTKKKKFLPIILGSDDNAYGVARLIYEKYKVRSLLVCSSQRVATKYSVLFDTIIIKNFDCDEVFPDEMFKILKEKENEYEKLVVIPCSDYYVSMIVRYGESFKDLITNKFISKETLATLSTKDKFYELCEKYGLDYPKTVIVEKDDRLDIIDKLEERGIAFPIIVKPENSNAYEYLHCEFEGKKKVFFFKTKDEYLEVIRSMNKTSYGGKLIIQEFIEGGDTAMRVINTYSDKNGKVRVSSLGQPILEEYAPKTLGNYAAIISRYDIDLYKKVADFLEKIGYVGFSNIDMKYDKKSGKYMMFELNPRQGRSSFFVHGAGANLIGEMIDDVVFDIKRETPLFTQRKSLWTSVSKKIIEKYVSDENIKREALELIKNGRCERTLFYARDFNPIRFPLICRYYIGFERNYKKYYFDKTVEFKA